MEELRFALLIFGGCAIVAILAHGLWSLRKDNKPADKPRVEPKSYESDAEGFDEFGVGEVRVVHPRASVHDKSPDLDSDEADDTDLSAYPSMTNDLPSRTKTNLDAVDDVEKTPDNTEFDESSESEPNTESEPKSSPVLEPKPEPVKLYGAVVSNPKPSVSPVKSSRSAERVTDSTSVAEVVQPIPEPPPFLLKTETMVTPEQETPDSKEANVQITRDEVSSFSLNQTPGAGSLGDDVSDDTEETLLSQSKRAVQRKRHRTIQRKRVEPSLGEDQMRIDFDSNEQNNDSAGQGNADRQNSQSQPSAVPEQEVLVLNVRAPSEQEINGSELLPMLLTLGFKFGDQDIFHRHVNSNGKGPVLFSLANMFKPGIFDIDNLENFTTQGVSLFMILPIEGDPHQVFNMMHNAARKLAEEFSCQILDGRRSVLTKQGLQQYVEKIREFERQRIISRH